MIGDRHSTSFESTQSILSEHGDTRNLQKDMNRSKLSPEWNLNKSIEGENLPALDDDISEDIGVAADKLKFTCAEVEPINCSICHGPVIVATSPLCGHIFCLDCITCAKNHGYKCPLCKDSLDKLVRIYAIDEQMEEYFESTWAPEVKSNIEAKRKARIQKLIKKMELEKNSMRWKLKKLLEIIQIPIDKYGFTGCLRHYGTQTCYNCYSVCCEKSPSWIHWKSIIIVFILCKCWDLQFDDFRPFLGWIYNLLGELLKDKPFCPEEENNYYNINVFTWIHRVWKSFTY